MHRQVLETQSCLTQLWRGPHCPYFTDEEVGLGEVGTFFSRSPVELTLLVPFAVKKPVKNAHGTVNLFWLKT